MHSRKNIKLQNLGTIHRIHNLFSFILLPVQQNALYHSIALECTKNSAVWVSRVAYRLGSKVILGLGDGCSCRRSACDRPYNDRTRRFSVLCNDYMWRRSDGHTIDIAQGSNVLLATSHFQGRMLTAMDLPELRRVRRGGRKLSTGQ